MSWIKRAWRGEEKIWKVFWLYGMLYPIALIILIVIIIFLSIFLLRSIGVDLTLYLPHTPADPKSGWFTPIRTWRFLFVFNLLDIFIRIPYCLWIGVSTWRCAFNLDNSGAKIWGYLARVCAVFLYLYLIFDGGSILSSLPALSGNKTELYKLTCEYNMALYAKKENSTYDEKYQIQYIKEHPNDLEDCIKSLSNTDLH